MLLVFAECEASAESEFEWLSDDEGDPGCANVSDDEITSNVTGECNTTSESRVTLEEEQLTRIKRSPKRFNCDGLIKMVYEGHLC